MGNKEKLYEMIIEMVRDLERTRHDYNGYAYVRTMRNILVGKKDAAIAPYFSRKPYYGVVPYLGLNDLEGIMDGLVRNNRLDIIFTEHGKLYCTHEWYMQSKKI